MSEWKEATPSGESKKAKASKRKIEDVTPAEVVAAKALRDMGAETKDLKEATGLSAADLAKRFKKLTPEEEEAVKKTKEQFEAELTVITFGLMERLKQHYSSIHPNSIPLQVCQLIDKIRLLAGQSTENIELVQLGQEAKVALEQVKSAREVLQKALEAKRARQS